MYIADVGSGQWGCVNTVVWPEVASFPGFPSTFPLLAVRDKRRKGGGKPWERG